MQYTHLVKNNNGVYAYTFICNSVICYACTYIDCTFNTAGVFECMHAHVHASARVCLCV